VNIYSSEAQAHQYLVYFILIRSGPVFINFGVLDRLKKGQRRYDNYELLNQHFLPPVGTYQVVKLCQETSVHIPFEIELISEVQCQDEGEGGERNIAKKNILLDHI
jgi:hypothetical protein